MPDPPIPKPRPHPAQFVDPTRSALNHKDAKRHEEEALCASRSSESLWLNETYAELQVTTNFTFLTGASHPDEYVTRAAELGLHAVAITDVNTLAGIVRAHVAAKQAGVRLVVGSHLKLRDPAIDVLIYPTGVASYGRLCRLLTLGKRRTTKGNCDLSLHDLIAHHDGLLAVVVPPTVMDSDFLNVLRGLRDVFDDDRLSLAASRPYDQRDAERLRQIAAASRHTGVPMVATNDAHHHVAERKPLHDVVTCIRHGCTIEQAGFRIQPNAERHLKPADEMRRLFADHPDALARTVAIADRAATFTLDDVKYQYPDEVVPEGRTPMQHLTELTQTHARQRFPDGVPAKVRKLIDHELALIGELDYAHYFLTVYDIVVFAKSRGILCQGRGAAANSVVCFVLGITAVDPMRVDMLFERFVSRERDEPPDIDIDFEHERREEVIQYLYEKYGRDRAALTAEVISYRGRMAVREVGKVLGLSLDAVDRLAKNLDWWDSDVRADRIRELGFNPDSAIFRRLVDLATQLQGFPRHLSQHVGGFVITQRPLCELVPIENAAMPDRTVIEWDKDDIDAMGMLKVDCLGLGMMTCIRKALDMINALPRSVLNHKDAEKHEGHKVSDVVSDSSSFLCSSCLFEPSWLKENLRLDNVPAEDPAVYAMICDADTVGVFQIESRAQMSMLPRLRPRCYYDLVIEVAIVRPGPIQGQMVHPYLRRRRGEEPVTYPDERVRGVLAKTLGVPLFQEQVMALAVEAAGFTPGEADRLRRAIAAWKSRGHNRILDFQQRFMRGMDDRGYDRDFAHRLFEQIKGFGDYGFPESHAASFALLVYVSAWLKCHHPAAFAAALINSQPMGFYAPAQIVRDAREHGVEVRDVDVNHSVWDCTLESPDVSPAARHRASGVVSGRGVMRLGMRLVRGLREAEAEAIAAAARARGPFDSLAALWRHSGVRAAALRKLAKADAMRSMGLDRQAALWQVRALHDEDLPLFDRRDARDDAPDEGARHKDASQPASATPARGHVTDDPPVALPPMTPLRQVVQDYEHVGMSLRAHPMSFLRGYLDGRGVVPAHELTDEHRHRTGARIDVAGLVLCRQRPSTASGVIFMTLEDETGVANLIVRPHVYEKYRHAGRHGTAIVARGKVERDGQVVHVLAQRLTDVTERLQNLVVKKRNFR